MRKENLLSMLRGKNIDRLTITKLETVKKMGYPNFKDFIVDLKELEKEGKIKATVDSVLNEGSKLGPIMHYEINAIIDIDDFSNEIDNLKAITIEIL